MVEQLLLLDESIFVFIHRTLENDFLNTVLPLLRSKFFWIPFYIFVITLMLTSYTPERSSWYLLMIVISVMLIDTTTGQILKKTVQRDRPCWSDQINIEVSPKVYCSNSYSFPSAHAANHFGLAFILSTLIFGRRYQKWLLYAWATLISLAQVYVGIHYPSDIIAGALIGLFIAWLTCTYILPRNTSLVDTTSL